LNLDGSKDFELSIQDLPNITVSDYTKAAISKVVTARTKCYSREGSFVDCTIEDTKLKREEEEGREEE
jgi:hypothetical protein